MSSNAETSTLEISPSIFPSTDTVVPTGNDEITSNVQVTGNVGGGTPEVSPEVSPSHKITVARFELYPKDQPTCYCVGFSVTCNGQTMYRDTQVPLDQVAECGCETEIAQIAYESLKASLDSWIATASSKPPILGQTFVPLA